MRAVPAHIVNSRSRRKVNSIAEIKSFKDLDAWKAGIHLTVAVYGLVKRLPDSERFGLISQMRRAAVSVPTSPKVRQRGREGCTVGMFGSRWDPGRNSSPNSKS